MRRKMELPIYFQFSLFLYSMLFGISCGLLYNIFCVLRIFFGKSKIAVCIQDIIYFIICTAAMFLFIYILNRGELRAYIILTAVLTALLYHLTVGRLITDILKNAVAIIRNKIKSRKERRVVKRRGL
ncbi:MAG: hypothetical protein DBX47_06665 [Clostridiales bacterium]|nr:MAG: hypothetical protein DBX47_06665 [Clostridiales bacterium]